MENRFAATSRRAGSPVRAGTPGGRPKRTPLTDACREVLAQPVPGDEKGRTHAQAIAEKLAAMPLAGDIAAARELADRAEGKARQTIDVGNAALREAYERLSEEELKDYINDGKLPLWFPREEAAKEQQMTTDIQAVGQ